jgi:hypothetical protein
MIQSIGLIATYWTLIATCPGGGERYGADETTKGRVLAFRAHAAVLEGDVVVAMVFYRFRGDSGVVGSMK